MIRYTDAMANYTKEMGRFVNPEMVVTHFHLRAGDSVADLGAGKGRFMSALVNRVGPEGQVYMLELQKSLLESLGDEARRHGWSFVQPLWADLEAPRGTKLSDEVLEVAFMANVFFQLNDRTTCLTEVRRILRPGGKFFVIDWSESFAGLGPQTEDVVSETDARAQIESAGFVFERNFDAGDHHYGLAFRRP